MKVRITPRDMEAVRALIDGAAPDPFVPGFSYDGTELVSQVASVTLDGHVSRPIVAAEEEDCRIALGKAKFALDLAAEREEILTARAERWRGRFWTVVMIPVVMVLAWGWIRVFESWVSR